MKIWKMDVILRRRRVVVGASLGSGARTNPRPLGKTQCNKSLAGEAQLPVSQVQRRKKGLVKANYILVLRNAVRQLTRITLRSSRPLYAMAFIPVLWRKARF